LISSVEIKLVDLTEFLKIVPSLRIALGKIGKLENCRCHKFIYFSIVQKAIRKIE
jgi:hypothetical protein